MSQLSRRQWLAGAGGMTGLMIAGWGVSLSAKPVEIRKMTMFKSPTCGCCGKWAAAAEAAGFEVAVMPAPDMQKVKQRLGVPDSLLSCHTSVVGRYVIEGHVPLESVKQLLRSAPDIRGIGVAGMPIGTPGMEVPGAPAQPFEVMAFDSEGRVSRFS